MARGDVYSTSPNIQHALDERLHKIRILKFTIFSLFVTKHLNYTDNQILKV